MRIVSVTSLVTPLVSSLTAKPATRLVIALTLFLVSPFSPAGSLARAETILTSFSGQWNEMFKTPQVFDFSLYPVAGFRFQPIAVGTLRNDNAESLQALNENLHSPTLNESFAWNPWFYNGSEYEYYNYLPLEAAWTDGTYTSNPSFPAVTVDSQVTSLNGFNLHGMPHQVTAVELVVHSLRTYDSPQAPWYPASDISFTVNLLGTVPEPRTLCLALLAVTGLCTQRWYKAPPRSLCSR